MVNTLPRMTRVYQNHHLDSTRWDRYRPRENDVIVSTSYKSGTTWMQMILYQLLKIPTEYVFYRNSENGSGLFV